MPVSAPPCYRDTVFTWALAVSGSWIRPWCKEAVAKCTPSVRVWCGSISVSKPLLLYVAGPAGERGSGVQAVETHVLAPEFLDSVPTASARTMAMAEAGASQDSPGGAYSQGCLVG